MPNKTWLYLFLKKIMNQKNVEIESNKYFFDIKGYIYENNKSPLFYKIIKINLYLNHFLIQLLTIFYFTEFYST